MFRYYDPMVCPDCHDDLPLGVSQCPHCDLNLSGEVAVQLQQTLQYADQLLAQMRRPVPAATVPAAGAATAETSPTVPAAGPGPTGGLLDGMTSYPSPARPAPAEPTKRSGLRPTSVATILLTLGAGCLLIACLIFLAVTWTYLGVAGRTAVVVVLTAASAGLVILLSRRDQRIGAEALTVVTLGLVMLDLFGAGRAGWLGPSHVEVEPWLYGIGLTVASTLFMLHRHHLRTAELALVAGIVLTISGLPEDLGLTEPRAVLAVLVLTGLVALGIRRDHLVLPGAAGAAAALAWLILLGSAWVRAAEDPTFAGVWTSGAGPWMVVASLLVLLPSLFLAKLRATRPGDRPDVGVVAALLTLTAALPVLDESLTAWTVTSTGVLLVWTAVGHLVERAGQGRIAALVPIALSPLPLVFVLPALLGSAGLRTLPTDEPFSRGLDAPLESIPFLVEAWTLLPAVLALGLAWVVVQPAQRARAVQWTIGAAAVASIATLALLDVPRVAVVLAVLALGVAVWLLRLRSSRPVFPLLGLGVLVAAVLISLPSSTTTLISAAVLGCIAGAALLLDRERVSDIASEALLPLAATTVVWAVVDLVEADLVVGGLVAICVNGALAIVRPRTALEVSAALAAFLSSVTTVDSNSAVALHLTVAGVLVTVSSLVNSERRPLAWVGGLLLALASWVRLADLGVGTPEAYTLPSAVVLLLVGLWKLQRDPAAGTALALGPALSLATVPSLLWALADPISLRALLLGAACVTLLIGGLALRWSAPVVVGGVAGALLLLGELAPYTLEVPQWMVIGAAGTLLIVAGITWEWQLTRVKQAAGYVSRLR